MIKNDELYIRLGTETDVFDGETLPVIYWHKEYAPPLDRIQYPFVTLEEDVHRVQVPHPLAPNGVARVVWKFVADPEQDSLWKDKDNWWLVTWHYKLVVVCRMDTVRKLSVETPGTQGFSTYQVINPAISVWDLMHTIQISGGEMKTLVGPVSGTGKGCRGVNGVLQEAKFVYSRI